MANLTLRSNLTRSLTHAELDGNFEYFTGSIDTINDATGSFLTSADTGSFLTAAQTASLNISDTLYTVKSALSASTTSNVGGRVNNYPVDTPAILPPDGNLHEFICIKNPLPGEWTWSAPATGQYDSGEISVSLTAGSADGYNPWVTAINSTKYTVTKSSFISTGWAYNGKNKPAQLPTPLPSTNTVYNYNYATAFRPETPWKGIAKIKVYTNLLPSVDEFGDPVYSGEIRLNAVGENYYYDIVDGTPLNNAENSQKTLFQLYPSNIISGTPTTGSSPYTSANIGDPGTIWTEKVAFADDDSDVNLDGEYTITIVQGTFIGNKSLGNEIFTGTYPSGYTGELVEKFYSSYISFQIQPFASDFDYGAIPDFKFRFIIEYYQ